jgi:DNA-binding transcriptional MocR family regulator
MPISRLVLEASPGEGVVMGFAAVSDREIARGIDELAQVIDSCRKEQKRVQAAG